MTSPVGTAQGSTPVTGAAVPSSGSASTPLNSKGTMDKDAFLKLLVTQMKNQDPMNPQGNEQMAAQLAQFSSLEQMQQMNQTLSSQAAGTSSVIASIQSSAAMGTLGKTVVATGDALVIPANTDPTKLTVDARITDAGGTATLQITDDAGSVVGSRSLGVLGTGPFTADLGAAAAGLAAGNYHFAVKVTGADGKVTSATTYTTGKVDSVQSSSTGPILIAGPIAIPFASVIEIRN